MNAVDATEVMDAIQPTKEFCAPCGAWNVFDNRAPKCPHFCMTCSSSERRLADCKAHPEKVRIVK